MTDDSEREERRRKRIFDDEDWEFYKTTMRAHKLAVEAAIQDMIEQLERAEEADEKLPEFIGLACVMIYEDGTTRLKSAGATMPDITLGALARLQYGLISMYTERYGGSFIGGGKGIQPEEFPDPDKETPVQ